MKRGNQLEGCWGVSLNHREGWKKKLKTTSGICPAVWRWVRSGLLPSPACLPPWGRVPGPCDGTIGHSNKFGLGQSKIKLMAKGEPARRTCYISFLPWYPSCIRVNSALDHWGSSLIPFCARTLWHGGWSWASLYFSCYSLISGLLPTVIPLWILFAAVGVWNESSQDVPPWSAGCFEVKATLAVMSRETPAPPLTT